MSDRFLLNDADIARFLVNGYHLVEPELPDGLNETIAAQLDALDHNPGDAITEAVPELWQVLDHPAVKGALISLLGADYEVQSHRHWHCKQPGAGHMNWHQDGLNSRDTLLNRFLGLYYPTDITPERWARRSSFPAPSSATRRPTAWPPTPISAARSR